MKVKIRMSKSRFYSLRLSFVLWLSSFVRHLTFVILPLVLASCSPGSCLGTHWREAPASQDGKRGRSLGFVPSQGGPWDGEFGHSCFVIQASPLRPVAQQERRPRRLALRRRAPRRRAPVRAAWAAGCRGRAL